MLSPDAKVKQTGSIFSMQCGSVRSISFSAADKIAKSI